MASARAERSSSAVWPASAPASLASAGQSWGAASRTRSESPPAGSRYEAFFVLLPSSAFLAPASQPVVQERQYHDDAQDDKLLALLQAVEGASVLNDRHEKRPDDRAGNIAHAAEQARPPDDGSRNAPELDLRLGGRLRDPVARHFYYGCQARQEPAKGHDGDGHAGQADSRQPGGLPVAAHRVDRTPPPCARQQHLPQDRRPQHDEEGIRDADRVRPQQPGTDLLVTRRQPGDIYLMGDHQRQPPANQHGAERDDKGGDAPESGQRAVSDPDQPACQAGDRHRSGHSGVMIAHHHASHAAGEGQVEPDRQVNVAGDDDDRLPDPQD